MFPVSGALAREALRLLYSACRSAARACMRTRGARHAAPNPQPGAALPLPEPLARLLPIVLPHLPPDATTALWRASRSLARLVWDSHAPGPSLSLALDERHAAYASRPGRSRRGFARLDAPALLQLIDLSRPSAAVPSLGPEYYSRIRALRLRGMRLMATELRRVLLQLPRLYELEILGCELLVVASTSTFTLPQPAHPPPSGCSTPPPASHPTLRSLVVLAEPRWGGPAREAQPLPPNPTLRMALASSLVDPPQLHCLTTDDPAACGPECDGGILQTLPALRCLRLVKGQCRDELLEHLLAASDPQPGCCPRLREVCVPELILARDHYHYHREQSSAGASAAVVRESDRSHGQQSPAGAPSAVVWDELRLLCGTSAQSLGALPLGTAIAHITVQQWLVSFSAQVHPMPIPWDVAWERLPRLPRSALSLEPAVSPYHFHDLGPFSVARPGVAMGPARPPAPPPSWSSLLSSPGFSMEAVLTKCNLLQNSLGLEEHEDHLKVSVFGETWDRQQEQADALLGFVAERLSGGTLVISGAFDLRGGEGGVLPSLTGLSPSVTRVCFNGCINAPRATDLWRRARGLPHMPRLFDLLPERVRHVANHKCKCI